MTNELDEDYSLCQMCDGNGGWDSEGWVWWEECPHCDGTGSEYIIGLGARCHHCNGSG